MSNKKLIWLPEAQHDIARLHEFLKDKSPKAAKRIIELILIGSDKLIENPEIGKPLSDELKRRELYLTFGVSAYVLRYKLTDSNIVIIRVWHSRENR